MSRSTVKRIRILVILFYAFVFAGLALYDEKPNSKLAWDMSHPPAEVVGPGNVWIAFLGFRAPNGASPYTCGLEKMREVQNALRTVKNVKEVLRISEDDTGDLTFQGEIPRYNRKDYCGTPAYAAAHVNEIHALLQRNHELLSRYESLHTYPRYTEPIDYGLFGLMPCFLAIKKAAQARMLRMAVSLNVGDTEKVLEQIRKEVEFWKFIARSSTTLLSKMVAITVLKLELRFAGDLAACRRLNVHELATLRNILKPFDKGEADLVACLRGESRYFRKSVEIGLLGLHRYAWLPVTMIFKPNATGNRTCDRFYRCGIRYAEMTPREFFVEIREKTSWNPRKIGLPFLYNPAGEICSYYWDCHTPYYPAYIQAGHDLEGLRRLILIKLLAIEQNVTKEEMQQFLAANRGELGNPYTGAPMKWDPSGCIFFIGTSKKRTQVYMPYIESE